MIETQIAHELKVADSQVNAAIKLLDGGATVPFIARYRKEATQGLDDSQLRMLETRLSYLRELDGRKQTILRSIDEQGKLTPVLKTKIASCDNKTELEDLYLPYKPKRVTKGQIAIKAGLEPLADKLLVQPDLIPDDAAIEFLNPQENINDSKAALDGAKYILMERFSEDAVLLNKLRKHLQHDAFIQSEVVSGKEKEGQKYNDYFAHSERLTRTPSHRALALFRGRNEGILNVSLNADPNNEEGDRSSYCEVIIAQHFDLAWSGKATDKWLQSVVQWTWRIKLQMKMETELFGQLREQAETDAIQVFAKNLNDLLMAAPAGNKVTMGLDPGLRTGCKVAVIDATGKVLDTATIFPHAPQNQWDKSARTLVNLCRQHKVSLISVGNGTASRETDKLAAQVISEANVTGLSKVMVSEAGASVYSASELASSELPQLDVSIRGAVSIARRLQDPLAELVKIEPKAIGVGQYQHDVSQSQLGRTLETVVEDCVNAVGVDLNTASPALLSHVSGLNKTLANNIVNYRELHGAFKQRKALMEVSRLGAKAYEQAAGFLRIRGGENPLDQSSVHPETYSVVESMLKVKSITAEELIGNKTVIGQINANDYVSDTAGLLTIEDILLELEKPGRDPRPEFKTATFKEGVNTISDLTVGMVLEGVVSNVANFGAFVDVGVHQDGLVHISAMTDKFISDPREVVKAGDIVKVKVMEVDVPRKRIGFSMRLNDTPEENASPREKRPVKTKVPRKEPKMVNNAMGNAFADALAGLKKK